MSVSILNNLISFALKCFIIIICVFTLKFFVLLKKNQSRNEFVYDFCDPFENW